MHCDHCGEEIRDGERCNHFVEGGGDFHHECATRMVAGSLGHQMGLCRCCGVGIYDDPPGVSKREAALVSMRYFIARRKIEAIDPDTTDRVGMSALTEMALFHAFRGVPHKVGTVQDAAREALRRSPEYADLKAMGTLIAQAVPSIVCPRCKRRSFNPNDVQSGYCGACHEYHDSMNLQNEKENALGDDAEA